MRRSFILPTSLLSGTIIGAGIFSLPYVFSKAGIASGLFFLIFLTAVALFTHLMYADIILRTDHDHKRFPGYAEMYFGRKTRILAEFTTLAAMFMTLTVYLVLSASFINLVIPAAPEAAKIIIFWILGTIMIFLNIRKAALFESATTIITLGIILTVFAIGLFSNPSQIISSPVLNLNFIFLPFGAILFSMLGESGIPPVLFYSKKENLKSNEIKRIITWGTVIPAVFYLMFVIGIFGISKQISDDAISGLIGRVSPVILAILGILGFVSLWDSYSAIGTDIKKTMEYEWSLPRRLVDIIIIFTPLILYFIGFRNFMDLIGLVGGILYSVWAILIILVWRKSAQTHPFPKNTILKSASPLTIYLLLFTFLLAIIYHIIKFF